MAYVHRPKLTRNALISGLLHTKNTEAPVRRRPCQQGGLEAICRTGSGAIVHIFGKSKPVKAARFSAPGGLERIRIPDVADPGAPSAGEIRVRIHANSLNFHDFSVAMGYLPSEDGRILMSDGAGVVEAVGAGVQEFRVGDNVVSCFFPDWQQGDAPLAGFARTPWRRSSGPPPGLRSLHATGVMRRRQLCRRLR